MLLAPTVHFRRPFSLVPGSTLGVKGEKIGVGKKKRRPFFFAFFPTAEPSPRLTPFLCRAMSSGIAWLGSRETWLGS